MHRYACADTGLEQQGDNQTQFTVHEMNKTDICSSPAVGTMCLSLLKPNMMVFCVLQPKESLFLFAHFFLDKHVMTMLQNVIAE